MARATQHWSQGLLVDLSFPSEWILHNDNIVVIADKYPKAKFHYLVLPKANIPSIFDVSGLFIPKILESLQKILSYSWQKTTWSCWRKCTAWHWMSSKWINESHINSKLATMLSQACGICICTWFQLTSIRHLSEPQDIGIHSIQNCSFRMAVS